VDRPEIDRDEIATRLDDIIRRHGYNLKELEEHMGRGRGYVAEALRGDKKLTVELIFEVLAALGADAREIFAKSRRGSPWDDEVAEDGSTATVEALAPWLRDSSPVLHAVVLTLADKGVASIDEIEARLRRLRGSSP